jgi:signal transduction histidine kinase
MKYLALLALALLQVVLSVMLGHKRQSPVSRTLIQFMGLLFAWTLINTLLDYVYNSHANFLGDYSQRLNLLNFANKAGFFLGAINIAMFSRLMMVFPVPRKETRKSKAILYGGVLVALLTLFDAVSGTYVSNGPLVPPSYSGTTAQILIPAYFLIVAVFSVGIAAKEMGKTKELNVKRQIRTILVALLAAAVIAIAMIIIMPLLFKDHDEFIFLGYFAPYIFTSALLYSIFKQGFLDFRPIIARSFGYIFSLAFLGLLYGFGAFVITDNLLFHSQQTTTAQRIIYVSLALLFGLSFAPAKRVFDKLSNKIFYRDAYDTQYFIDTLTNILVTNTDITRLLHESSDLINANLKPSYTKFILAGSDRKLRFVGRLNHTISQDNAKELLEFASKFKESIINVETLHRQDHRMLRRLLERKNAALIVKLTSHDELMGILLVGVKRSGNMYSTKDINVFEIVADELSLAIENSLRYEEIGAFNETLQQKVSDATRELRRTNDKLKALDEAKDEFISMASHQLRTPLTSVKGYISMVLDGDAGELNEQQKKLLQQSFISSQRMVYLIADLLNVSRLRTGKFIIETTPTYLPDIVEEEVSQLQETATARGLKIFYDKPTKFPELGLDETKIRQVIMNFLDNAIYYTPAGGRITVNLEASAKAAGIRITDTGLGVPKDERHKLFEKFYRASNAKRARPDGTGLGLFMAKKVIVAQGGAIIFASEEGKGSSFGFSFPLSKLAVAEKPVERLAN